MPRTEHKYLKSPKVKVVCLADTQGYANQIDPRLMPAGDMLVMGGDIAGGGSLSELGAFDNWLGELPYEHKIIVGGNHDQGLRGIKGNTFFNNAIYLQDELIEVEGLKIYGSPLNEMNELRLYHDWAFCDPRYLQRATEAIPDGVDILITHGGPFGILDQLKADKRSVGSRDLLRAVKRAKPRYHVFGHIHEAYGQIEIDDTHFINAAICDERNNLFDKKGALLQPPQVVEIESISRILT